MVNVTQKQPTVSPKVSPKVQGRLDMLERLLLCGASTNIIKEEFVKDELFIMLMYFREKNLFLEMTDKPEYIDLLTDYEEVENV